MSVMDNPVSLLLYLFSVLSIVSAVIVSVMIFAKTEHMPGTVEVGDDEPGYHIFL